MKQALNCGKSINSPKDLGLAGLTFRVILIDRNKQPKEFRSIKDLHYISYVSYVYDDKDIFIGIKFLEQSLFMDKFKGTVVSKEKLDELWNGTLFSTTNSLDYDLLKYELNNISIPSIVLESETSSRSTTASQHNCSKSIPSIITPSQFSNQSDTSIIPPSQLSDQSSSNNTIYHGKKKKQKEKKEPIHKKLKLLGNFSNLQLMIVSFVNALS